MMHDTSDPQQRDNSAKVGRRKESGREVQTPPAVFLGKERYYKGEHGLFEHFSVCTTLFPALRSNK